MIKAWWIRPWTTKRQIFWLLVGAVIYCTGTWIERAYWRYWDFKPVTIHSISILNPGKTALAGGLLIYEVDMTKNMATACTVKRQLVDGHLIDYDEVAPPAKPLGRQKAVASVSIPRATDTSTWFMRYTLDCPMGPEGRHVYVNSRSEDFRVVGSDITGHAGPKGDKGDRGSMTIVRPLK